MRVLITGGTGLIGSRVAHRLLDRGDEVTLLDVEPDLDRAHELATRYGDTVGLVTGDVLDQHRLSVLLTSTPVDAIVHLAHLLGSACERRPRAATEINLVGTANVFELAREHSVPRVVLASSVSVYGADADYPDECRPVRESAAQLLAQGVRIYGASKVYLEALAGAYRRDGGPLIVGLRPSIVYGGFSKNGSVDWIHAAVSGALRGDPVVLQNGGAHVSLVHLDDVADQFAALVAAPAEAFETTFFLNSGGDTCSIDQLADELRHLVPGSAIRVEPGSSESLMGLVASVDGSAMEALIGHPRRMSPLSSGLTQFVQDVTSGRAHL